MKIVVKIVFSIALYFMVCVVNAQYLDTIQPKRLRKVIISESAFYLSGNAFLQYIWYKDHERVPFQYYNDNKGYLQIDKCGHAYGAYQYSRKGYDALRWAGVSHKKALWYGGPLGLILQTPIEVFDGIYEGYGFSKGDMVANAAGSALFMLQQGLLKDQTVKMKFSYSPSPYAKINPRGLGDTHLERFFMDYNGHTYWLSANFKQISGIKKMPAWFNVAVGYSGNGMLSEFSNRNYYNGVYIQPVERYRQWFFSLDVDMSKIKTKRKFLKGLFSVLNAVKIPFPALEYSSVNHFKLKPIYF
jgi:hypothetical protein